MKIWLDDVRDPKYFPWMAPMGDDWIWMKRVDDVITALKTGKVESIHLDHDLGVEDERTGYEVLAWLEEQIGTGQWPFSNIPEMYIHTDNPVGRERMKLAHIRIVELLDKE